MSFSFYLQWESDLVKDIYSYILTEDEGDSLGVFADFHKLKVNGFHICLEGERVGVIQNKLQARYLFFFKKKKKN